MDYKEKLRKLKQNKEWEKLLSTSLALYEQNKKDRYIVRMIVLAYEKLGNEEDAIQFWEILAKGENRPEEFSKKLAAHYKKCDNKESWIKWTKKLLFQVLRKKDFATLEDLWMQLIEAEAIDKNFAFEVTHKIELLEEKERAFTLLDLFLLSMEEKQPLSKALLEISKRMLKINSDDVGLRKRLEGYYRKIYTGCSEIENFFEKVELTRNENVEDAIVLLEKLINLCPGKYVMNKSWGIGRIRSVDLLFNKVFVDFPAYPEHAISLDLAFKILSPLDEDDFPVLRIKKMDYLVTLKKENPAQLIKLMLKKETNISQDRVRTLLDGIVNNDEWKSFIDKIKKSAKSEGLQVTRKGNKYLFALASISKRKRLSIEDVASVSNLRERIKALLSFQKENLSLEEKKKWITYTEEIIKDKDVELQERIELLFALYDVIENKKRLKEGLELLLKDIKENEKVSLISRLSQKRYKKELLRFIGAKDYRFVEKIFLETTDDWLRSHSQTILEKKGDMEKLWHRVLQNPYKNPLCFLYSADMVMKRKEQYSFIDKPIILFESLIEFMSKKDVLQKTRAKAKTVFSKYGFDLFRWLLETSSREEIKVLLDIIRKEISIDSEDKRVFERLAETKYPTFKEKDVEEFFYVTRESLKEKKQELDHLLKVEIPANSESIGKAARQGDLSENFDYISAKEKQRRLIDRVNILKDELSKARPIEEIAYIVGQVGIGTRVLLEGVENGEKREILILGPWDNHPAKEVISHTAPLAGELIGKKVGETFFDKYHKKTYQIVSVEKYHKSK